jgi:hypothetical protein
MPDQDVDASERVECEIVDFVLSSLGATAQKNETSLLHISLKPPTKTQLFKNLPALKHGRIEECPGRMQAFTISLRFFFLEEF